MPSFPFLPYSVLKSGCTQKIYTPESQILSTVVVGKLLPSVKHYEVLLQTIYGITKNILYIILTHIALYFGNCFHIINVETY